MTRINLIPVNHLLDQHLMAEYRELPMIHAALERSKSTKTWTLNTFKLPVSYTLNTGHVKFFYNKGSFLRERYNLLVQEL